MTDAGASASGAPKTKISKTAAGAEAGEKKRFEVKKVRLPTTREGSSALSERLG